jgi:hypothetical protein
MIAFTRLLCDPRNINQSEFSRLSDEKLLGMASLMMDEGYGSFDRCYSLIRCVRGNLKEAREISSQLMFHECQF